MSPSPVMSLIVATKGRSAPFRDLFGSLEAQTFRDFEVIVVDQNADGRLGSPDREGWGFPLLHLRTPHESGASRGRNAGFARANGSIILFPDDDCWYDAGFLADAMRRMTELGADVLSGRAADAAGRDINGRYMQARTTITRDNVWTAGIEWVIFFKREVFETLGRVRSRHRDRGRRRRGQSCEAQDIMLRALETGLHCVFDPAVYGHHAELDIRSPAMLRKGRAYARGFGYVLRQASLPASAGRRLAAAPGDPRHPGDPQRRPDAGCLLRQRAGRASRRLAHEPLRQRRDEGARRRATCDGSVAPTAPLRARCGAGAAPA